MNDMELKPEFIASLSALGPDAEGLADALVSGMPTIAVRVNTHKGATVPAQAERVPWCSEGFYLDSRPLFAVDPAWHQGRYYVQDASSMAVGAAAGVAAREFLANVPLRVLDACAAPGGKTIGLADALPQGSLIVANEFDPRRAAILAENICKYGSPDIVVSRGDARNYAAASEVFDIIAADMPCSGEGMMRKDSTARAQWSQQLVDSCAATQRLIATQLWKALKPGGLFIYSTCTFNRSENEANLEWLSAETGAESIALNLDSYPGVIPGQSAMHCYRFHPGKAKGEGLFLAVLRKPGTWKASTPSTATGNSASYPAARWLAEAETMTISQAKNGELVFVPSRHHNFLQGLRRYTTPLLWGTPLAVNKANAWLPLHNTAMSTALKPGAFPADELDAATALTYLHGNSIAAPNLPKGIYAPSFAGLPLGWAKNIGSRANNLLPTALRLRMDTTPDSTPQHIIDITYHG